MLNLIPYMLNLKLSEVKNSSESFYSTLCAKNHQFQVLFLLEALVSDTLYKTRSLFQLRKLNRHCSFIEFGNVRYINQNETSFKLLTARRNKHPAEIHNEKYMSRCFTHSVQLQIKFRQSCQSGKNLVLFLFFSLSFRIVLNDLMHRMPPHNNLYSRNANAQHSKSKGYKV